MPDAVHAATTFCRTLVDEWHRRGLRHAVVAPGSRSTPMALAVATHGDIAVHVHPDERSAAFVALGIGIATGAPAAVVTTSGTAAVELHPAVVEAHQAAVPLLAVTADRPPELQGVGAPQTIDQRRLYGDAVRWYAEPGPPEWSHAQGWRSLAADAIDRTGGMRPGPVHLNLAFREPLTGAPGEVPPPEDEPERARLAEWGLTDEQIARIAPLLDRPDGLIVAGARAANSDAEAAAIIELAELLDWPLLCDHPSGCRIEHPRVVTTFDPVLRTPGLDVAVPGVVLRFGGLLASRVAGEWLARSGAVQLAFDRFGLTPDPDGAVTDSFPIAPPEVAATLARAAGRRRRVTDPTDADGDRRAGSVWGGIERRARRALDEALAADPDAEPAIAAAVAAELPAGAELVVSSSMPVRDLEWYAPVIPAVRVRANRGANGIDGVISTAVGVALSGRPTAALVGDLAFLHDTNALIGLSAREVDLLVVVVDNDGGGIFSFLPQATEMEDERFEQLFGTPHGTDLVGLARAHNVEADAVGDATGVAKAVARWRRLGGVRVVVVRSDRTTHVAHHRRLQAAVGAALAG